MLLKTPAGRNFASENFISEVGNICFSTSIGRSWFKQELSNQIANTPDVLSWLSTVLKLHVEQGESDTVYHVVDHDLIANGDDVQKLSGFIIKGKLYPSTHIDEYAADKEQCTDCGCYVHCYKKIDGKTLCNKCISMSEDSSIRDQGRGASECANCSVTKCDNHMYKNIQRVM